MDRGLINMKYENGTTPFLNLLTYSTMWELNGKDVLCSVKALVSAGADTQALTSFRYNAYHLCCLASNDLRLSEYLFNNI